MGYQNVEQVCKRDVIGERDQQFTDRSMTLKAIVTQFTQDELVVYPHIHTKKKIRKGELRLQAAPVSW